MPPFIYGQWINKKNYKGTGLISEKRIKQISVMLKDQYQAFLPGYIKSFEKYFDYYSPEIKSLYTKCIDYNFFGGKMSRSILLLFTYWQNQPDDYSRHKYFQSAMKLAACIEMVR